MRELSRNPDRPARSPFELECIHDTVLNLDKIHLLFLLRTPEIMLDKCTALIIISFYSFTDYEILPHTPCLFRGAHGQGGHIAYYTVTYTHIVKIHLTREFKFIALISSIGRQEENDIALLQYLNIPLYYLSTVLASMPTSTASSLADTIEPVWNARACTSFSSLSGLPISFSSNTSL